MAPLTTKTGASGTVAVYHGRAKIGYLAGSDGRYHWELIMVSEQAQGHPRGVEGSRSAALAKVGEMFDRWLSAAGLEKKS